MMNPTWTSDCGTVKRDVRIYVLIEIDTNAIRYVGKTVLGVERRRIQHQQFARYTTRCTRLANWLRALERDGRSFRIVEVETVPHNGNWIAAERAWITRLRAAGCRLVNSTDGGEGLPGHVFSAEHRRNISAALYSQVTRWCKQCGQLFDAKPSDVSKGNGCFCSKPCYQKWQRGKPKKVVDESYGRAGRESAAAKRRAQVTCKRGHLLTGANVYVNNRGSRVCKECRRLHKEAYRAKGK